MTRTLQPDEIAVQVKDLREGDLVDLEGDEFFGDNVSVVFEYGEVAEIIRETDSCIVVGFEGIGTAGYAPDHVMIMKRRVVDTDEQGEQPKGTNDGSPPYS